MDCLMYSTILSILIRTVAERIIVVIIVSVCIIIVTSSSDTMLPHVASSVIDHSEQCIERSSSHLLIDVCKECSCHIHCNLIAFTSTQAQQTQSFDLHFHILNAFQPCSLSFDVIRQHLATHGDFPESAKRQLLCRQPLSPTVSADCCNCPIIHIALSLRHSGPVTLIMRISVLHACCGQCFQSTFMGGLIFMFQIWHNCFYDMFCYPSPSARPATTIKQVICNVQCTIRSFSQTLFHKLLYQVLPAMLTRCQISKNSEESLCRGFVDTFD
mmetsp:Transcript_56152/g.89071  ORF Transcript_56152/g.89071 Transcript_56152/m.89071 type:complete len:271 (+) Transcript_56152:196-1008(+)